LGYRFNLSTYEVDYLLQKGFVNITVIDIAPTLVNKLQKKYAGNQYVKVVLGDFFDHAGEYDLILEQTFFCALEPSFRMNYKNKMHSLLSSNGKLTGILFDKEFEGASPPFGGTKAEYEKLFMDTFEFIKFEMCYNSHHKRHGSELFVILRKNNKAL
jgi:methyl halide transferase